MAAGEEGEDGAAIRVPLSMLQEEGRRKMSYAMLVEELQKVGGLFDSPRTGQFELLVRAYLTA